MTDNTRTEALLPSRETLMAQAQVFASAWAIAGSSFDTGDGMEVAEQEKAILADMTRRLHARIAGLEAQIEALSGVQALSAAPAVPAGWKAVPVNPTPEMWKAAKTVPDPNPPYPPHYGLVWDAMLAASPTPPAEQQAAPKAAPEVGNSGFDYKTAADFLNGKTVSDEAVRKFVATSRWAHDERAALSATLLAMHGVLTSREAEIALLKKALLEAEAPPQQEAKEPSKAYAWVYVNKYGVESIPASKDWCTAMVSGHGGSMFPLYTAPLPAPATQQAHQQEAQEPVAVVVPCHTPSGKRVALYSAKQDLPIGTQLYTAPQPSPTTKPAHQPAPAPLSESIDQVERALAIIGVVGAIDGHDVVRRESVLEIARRAALAAQGGK